MLNALLVKFSKFKNCAIFPNVIQGKTTAFFFASSLYQQRVRLVIHGNLKMSLVSRDINNLYESLKTQALEKNYKSVAVWSKYINDLEMTKSLLSLFPKKVAHNVMVPVGPKALMQGKIVHTNEFLVNLGETWFVKRTAHQTIEMCDRRVKSCVEMLQKLEKERDLIVHKSTLPIEQEAFGSEERPEIIEYITEEQNQEWKERHRIKEKQYRQQLAELRNKEKKPIETEADLWKHLDELELQEELEDELNRLNAECSSEDVSEEIFNSNNLERKVNQNLESDIKRENLISENTSAVNSNIKRKVSFACDLDSSDDEPLRLEIKHSEVKPIVCDSNAEEINSPADIYNYYAKRVNKMPLSVLKCDVNFSKENNLDSFKNNEIFEDDDEEEGLEDIFTVSQGIRLNDISERCFFIADNIPTLDKSKAKKISQFKASRRKN